MATEDMIEEFFDEQFHNTSPFFLYKNKQLLKKGKFREYAQEQISKANKIVWSISFSLIVCSWYGINSLVEYGANPNWFDLTLGLTAWLAIICIVLFSAKEYYTIKSSMSLFLKLLDNTKTEATSHTSD